jgi:hypothetical protein
MTNAEMNRTWSTDFDESIYDDENAELPEEPHAYRGNGGWVYWTLAPLNELEEEDLNRAIDGPDLSLREHCGLEREEDQS